MTAEKAIEILRKLRFVYAQNLDGYLCNYLHQITLRIFGFNAERQFIRDWFDSQKPSETVNTEFLVFTGWQPWDLWWPREDYEIRLKFIDHLIQKIKDNPEIITAQKVA